MIFLLLKMFVYLVIAGAIGGGAGWLLRNLQAQRSDEDAHRQMHDAKSKLPQLESLLRSRDEQLTKMKMRQSEYKDMAKELQDQIATLEKDLKTERGALRRAKDALEARQFNETLDTEPSADAQALAAECAALRQELSEQQAQAEAANVQQNLSLKLEEELSQLQQQLKRSETALQREQAKVAELEKEQALHNKSLHVLHQQLELERNRRIASG